MSYLDWLLKIWDGPGFCLDDDTDLEMDMRKILVPDWHDLTQR